MTWRKRKDAGNAGNAGEAARTALLACLIAALLATSVAMVSAATTVDLGPKVGDILVFRHGARMPLDWDFTVASAGVPDATCKLTPGVMASDGGSLVVEQRFEEPRSFQVHWAGGHTSMGNTDCGDNAVLVVPAEDLQLLSNAVGGAGVEHKTLF